SLWLLFSFTLTVTTLSYTLSLHDALPICDRVILLRLGQREALRLKESELSAGAVAQTSTSRAYQPPPSVPEPSVDQGVDATDLGQQRNMIISRLGLSPASRGGYEIGPSAPAQVLDIVGLKAGDVLV